MISKRIIRRWHPRLRDYVGQLTDEGYLLECSKKHVILRSPDGRRVGTIACTTSDHRAALNNLADIRRTIADRS